MKLGTEFFCGGDQKEMNDATREKVASYVESRVGGIRCPDHDELPTVICSGSRLDNVSFQVKGCCQKIIHIVKSKLDA